MKLMLRAVLSSISQCAFIVSLGISVSCGAPPTTQVASEGQDDLRDLRSWAAVEASIEFLYAPTLRSGRHVEREKYAIRVPAEKREEWKSGQNPSEFIFGFGKEGPNFHMVLELKEDFIHQNSLPSSESSLAIWAANQAAHASVPWAKSWEQETAIRNDLGLPVIGLAEVGFSKDFSQAVVFLDYDRATAFHYYLRWNSSLSKYEVQASCLLYMS
jgi:hypothetical protein